MGNWKILAFVFTFAEKMPLAFKNIRGQFFLQRMDNLELNPVKLGVRKYQPVPAKTYRYPHKRHEDGYYRGIRKVFSFKITHDAHYGGIYAEEKFVCFLPAVGGVIEDVEVNAILVNIVIHIPVRAFILVIGIGGD